MKRNGVPNTVVGQVFRALGVAVGPEVETDGSLHTQIGSLEDCIVSQWFCADRLTIVSACSHGTDHVNDPLIGKHYPHAHRGRNGSSHSKLHPKQVVEEDDRVSDSCNVSSSVSASGRKACGNLDRFLESTTPMIPPQYLPKTIMKGWRACEVESIPFFTLGDLWESFDEWSAYGAGVPIVLNGSDTVVQYYVPYLSAIQLYTESSRPIITARRPGEDSDISDGDYRDTSSEGSSDGEAERISKYGGAMQWRNRQAFDCDFGSNLRFDRSTLRDRSKALQEGFSSDDGEGSSCLRFQYFERAAPYSREPLADKIADLARDFPQLKTLRSIDLLPTSWLSVAWYPIYRIPTGPTLRDLAACFLTFHSLSTPLKDGGNTQFTVGMRRVSGTCITNSGVSPKIALPVFGLASYKFKGTVWTTTGSCERQQADSLLQSADEWLRLHRVEHPDFAFFRSHAIGKIGQREPVELVNKQFRIVH
eukprot:Gb_02672 [translate_table: standard]